MPKIHINKLARVIDVPLGANLMQSLLNEGIPVASSCYGDGVCGKCRLEVISGSEFLSKPNALELFLKEKSCLGPNIRIACQAVVNGDVTVDASYW